jgi:hypothetical protein
VLLAVAVVTGATAYLIVRAAYGSLPTLSRFGPAGLAIVAAVLGLLAAGTRGRLAGRPGTSPIEPMLVARYAALAKASSLAGALACGAYGGVLGYVSRLSGPVPHSDTLTCALGVASSVALVVAAMSLERTCRVKQPPAGPDGDERDDEP